MTASSPFRRAIFVGGDVYGSVDRTVDALLRRQILPVLQVPLGTPPPEGQTPTVDLIIVTKNSDPFLNWWALHESLRQGAQCVSMSEILDGGVVPRLAAEGFSGLSDEPSWPGSPEGGPQEHDGVFYIPLWTGTGFVWKSVISMGQAAAVIAISLLAMTGTLLLQQAISNAR